jgi:hypothetical protein
MGQTLCSTKRRDKAIVETSLKGVVLLLNDRAIETVSGIHAARLLRLASLLEATIPTITKVLAASYPRPELPEVSHENNADVDENVVEVQA